MEKIRHETDAGMTLVEVLASVVVLGLLITVMLSLFAQSSTVTKQSAEKQEATILAQNVLSDMSEYGANSVIQNKTGDNQVPVNGTTNTINGVTYTFQLRSVDLPIWAGNKGIYAEVTVSWKSFQAGQKVNESIQVDQLFDH